MAYQHIVYERKGQTAWIYLNRPENMNSLSKALMKELLNLLQEIEQDESVRVLVLSGKGKVFCAGADLKELLGDLEKEPDGQDGLLDLAGKLFKGLNRFSKPLIAALNGITLAGGLEIAMTADIIIASETAKRRRSFKLWSSSGCRRSSKASSQSRDKPCKVSTVHR